MQKRMSMRLTCTEEPKEPQSEEPKNVRTKKVYQKYLYMFVGIGSD